MGQKELAKRNNSLFKKRQKRTILERVTREPMLKRKKLSHFNRDPSHMSTPGHIRTIFTTRHERSKIAINKVDNFGPNSFSHAVNKQILLLEVSGMLQRIKAMQIN